jgi:hypothetical protein
MKLAKVSALNCYTMKIVALCIATGTKKERLMNALDKIIKIIQFSNYL